MSELPVIYRLDCNGEGGYSHAQTLPTWPIRCKRTTQDGVCLKEQVQAMTASQQLLSNSIYLLLRKLVASEQVYIYVFI